MSKISFLIYIFHFFIFFLSKFSSSQTLMCQLYSDRWCGSELYCINPLDNLVNNFQNFQITSFVEISIENNTKIVTQKYYEKLLLSMPKLNGTIVVYFKRDNLINQYYNKISECNDFYDDEVGFSYGYICEFDLCIPRQKPICKTNCENHCFIDKECSEGENCVNNECVITCLNEYDCFNETICYKSICVLGCNSEIECGHRKKCLNNYCISITCTDDNTCNDGVTIGIIVGIILFVCGLSILGIVWKKTGCKKIEDKRIKTKEKNIKEWERQTNQTY